MVTRGLLNTGRYKSAGLLIIFSIIVCGSNLKDALAGIDPRGVPQRKIAAKTGRITRELIIEAQERLSKLGYWIAAAEGKWGDSSRHALIAFQKIEHRRPSGRLSMDEIRALRNASRPEARERGAAHIEVDLTRQVLMMVGGDGLVSKILPVSTGNGKPFAIEGETDLAVTPKGRFKVYRKLPGWRKSPLGLLYFPNYILGGIAIHGNPAVPVSPASHGCIRIPMFAAEEFSNLTPIGTQVLVYGDEVQ